VNEYKLQCEVVKYIQLRYPKVRYCASAGGVRTTISQARKMKASGYVKGFPDLQILEPKGGYHGMFLELKTLKGHPTAEQRQWVQHLSNKGYYAKIIKGIDNIIIEIDKYLKYKDTKVCNCE
jgi:hypothetical protein